MRDHLRRVMTVVAVAVLTAAGLAGCNVAACSADQTAAIFCYQPKP